MVHRRAPPARGPGPRRPRPPPGPHRPGRHTDTVTRRRKAGRRPAGRGRGLCAPGPALRVVLAPAGHGKTALTAAAADAVRSEGRNVVALASTNKAVAELRAAGLDASTIARWQPGAGTLEPGSVIVLDEVSQVSTRDAAVVLAAVAATPGASL
ncbi:MAG: AAA family ATPase [Acidimicrobiia bacterium]